MKLIQALPALLLASCCCGAPAANPLGPASARGLVGSGVETSKWYGPITIRFDLATTGSPYDSHANDVRVRFTAGGESVERLAYFDGQSWCAVLLAPKSGTYAATVYRNGRQVKRLTELCDATRLAKADFVRVAPDHRSFVTDSGEPYWPYGHNLAWRGGDDLPTVPEGLHQMAAAGLNWARIWACMWDEKNPWWPNDGSRLAIGDLWQPALKQWDAITQEASSDGVRVQWVLFHHGEVSSKVNPNWPDNPWNQAKGGFLAKPEDFFTDPRAKRLAMDYLRYVVARYAHQPGILGWELFNEVENTDSATPERWPEIEAWHKEMADYLHTIDPYGHPVMTSSEMRPGLMAAVDVAEPHGYPPNVGAMLRGAQMQTKEPFFYGEVGLGDWNAPEADQRRAIRDALWSAYLAGHSGAGQYWAWDAVQRNHMESEFGFGASLIRDLRLHPGPKVAPVAVGVEGDIGGDLVLNPSLGWTASTRREFSLPREAAAATAAMSTFLQGQGHPDMGSSFRFAIDAPSPGALKVFIATAARSGANVSVSVDGTVGAHQAFPATGGDHDVRVVLAAKYPKGHHEIVVSNDGPDWVTVGSYTFGNLGPAVDATGARDGSQFVVRVILAANTPPRYKLHLGDLKDGSHAATFVDLVKHTKKEFKMNVRNGWFDAPEPLTTSDGLWVVTSQ